MILAAMRVRGNRDGAAFAWIFCPIKLRQPVAADVRRRSTGRGSRSASSRRRLQRDCEMFRLELCRSTRWHFPSASLAGLPDSRKKRTCWLNYDVIIIGGGAAGLFCARVAARRGRRVLVLEHQARLGNKILISGGGRCNFTNLGATAANYVTSGSPHFLKSALARCSPHDFSRWSNNTASHGTSGNTGNSSATIAPNRFCNCSKTNARTRAWKCG